MEAEKEKWLTPKKDHRNIKLIPERTLNLLYYILPWSVIQLRWSTPYFVLRPDHPNKHEDPDCLRGTKDQGKDPYSLTKSVAG